MDASPGKFWVRSATPYDAQDLYRLQTEIYREGRWFVGDGAPAPAVLERRLRALNSSQSLYLVAERNDELTGWLELHRQPTIVLRHVAVLTLAVGSAWRGRGVGSALLQHGFEWAKSNGVIKVSLNVRAGNERAISLYRRFGFELEGRERAQIRTRTGFEDNLIMAVFLVSQESLSDALRSEGDRLRHD